MDVDDLIKNLEAMRERAGGDALVVAAPRPFKGTVRLVEAEVDRPGQRNRVVLW